MVNTAQPAWTFRIPFLNHEIALEKPQFIMLTLFLLLGLTVRLRNYLADISFWLDEAALANNLVALNFSQLLGPLDENQIAPIGFCLFEKAMLLVVGNYEFSLRFLPFVSGSIALILAFVLVYRAVGALPAILCTAQLAVIKESVYFANNLKPYASDLAIALGLAALAWTPHVASMSKKRLWILSLCGILAVWFSFPAIFVLGAISILYAVQIIHERYWRAALPVALMSLAWIVSFGVQYYMLQSGKGQSALTDAWTNRFVVLFPTDWSELKQNGFLLYYVFRNPLWTFHPIVSMPLYLAGCILLWKKSCYFLLIVLLPLVLNFISSGVHAYPFRDRLLQYAVVFLYVPIAFCLTRMVTGNIKYRWLKWLGVLLIIANLAEPTVNAAKHIWSPREYEQVGPVVTYLKAHKQHTDGLFVHAPALKAFKYYSNRFQVGGDRIYVSHQKHLSTPKIIDEEMRMLSGRIWLIFGHAKQSRGVDHEANILSVADRYGRRIDQYIDQGAATYLYLFP